MAWLRECAIPATGPMPRNLGYNPSSMRRWFITIFTLHFFFGVGAFAFGQIDFHPTGSAQSALMAEATGHLPDTNQKHDLLGSAPDHGLTDSQPEMPEVIDLDVATLLASPRHPAPADTTWVRLLSPTLEGLQRPPRAVSISA